MTQYVLKKDDKAKELLYALQNYEPVRFLITDTSWKNWMKEHEKPIEVNLKEEKLELKVEKDWKFYLSGKEIATMQPDIYTVFKLEYQDDKMFRIRPVDMEPNDKNMPEPAYSVFRNVLSNRLLEIWFKGKIPLENDGKDLWKIKK